MRNPEVECLDNHLYCLHCKGGCDRYRSPSQGIGDHAPSSPHRPCLYTFSSRASVAAASMPAISSASIWPNVGRISGATWASDSQRRDRVSAFPQWSEACATVTSKPLFGCFPCTANGASRVG